MVRIFLVILLILWLMGLLSHIGGIYIHILLIIAVILAIDNLLRDRSRQRG